MSIPERLTRIVRHKISEMKDRFDQMDEDALADPAEIAQLRRAQARTEAKQELQDSLTDPTPVSRWTQRQIRCAGATAQGDVGAANSSADCKRAWWQLKLRQFQVVKWWSSADAIRSAGLPLSHAGS